jgi:phosphopantothenoylcysteine decarboxylase
MSRRKSRILLGVTGSVAAVKFPQIVLKLNEFADVRVVLTNGALHMMEAVKAYDLEGFAAYTALVSTAAVLQYTDPDEWDGYKDVGKDPVLHIQVTFELDTLVC